MVNILGQFARPHFARPHFARPHFDKPHFDKPHFDRGLFNKGTLDRVESAIVLGLVGSSLAACAVGALIYDLGRLFSAW
jgi:hypothetical protein